MTKSRKVNFKCSSFSDPVLNMWHSFFYRIVHDLKRYLRTKNKRELKNILFWREFKAHFAGTYSWLREVLQPTYSEIQQFELLITKAKILVG